VRFILGVISEEIKISRVKRSVLVSVLKHMGFKTHSELCEILKEQKKPTVVSTQQEEGEGEDDILRREAQEALNLAPGEIHPKEYDYLLSLPMWSLTEERVEELQRQMHDKK